MITLSGLQQCVSHNKEDFLSGHLVPICVNYNQGLCWVSFTYVWKMSRITISPPPSVTMLLFRCLWGRRKQRQSSFFLLIFSPFLGLSQKNKLSLETKNCKLLIIAVLSRKNLYFVWICSENSYILNKTYYYSHYIIYIVCSSKGVGFWFSSFKANWTKQYKILPILSIEESL